MKNRRGRKSVLSEAGNEEWSDIRNRIIYGSAEWRILKLRELILAFKKEQATAQRNMLLKEQESCRNEIKAHRDNITRKELTPAQIRDRQRTITKYDEALRQIEEELHALEQGGDVLEQGKKRAWPLADNHLSARKALNEAKRYVLRDEIDALWRVLAAQFERAVINHDADWFERQAKAIEKGGMPQRVQFNTKVIDLLETEMWGTRAKQRAKQEKNEERWKEAQKKQQIEWEQYLDSPEGRTAGQGERQAKWASLVQSQKAKPRIESATLTPAGEFIDATAREFYEKLDKEECPTERQPHGVKVEGTYFENRERCCEAIRKLAQKYLKMRLRKEQGKHPRTKPSTPLSTDFYHGMRTAAAKLRQALSTEN